MNGHVPAEPISVFWSVVVALVGLALYVVAYFMGRNRR